MSLVSDQNGYKIDAGYREHVAKIQRLRLWISERYGDDSAL